MEAQGAIHSQMYRRAKAMAEVGRSHANELPRGSSKHFRCLRCQLLKEEAPAWRGLLL